MWRLGQSAQRGRGRPCGTGQCGGDPLDVTRSREMLERAVALRPEDGSIVDSLGWVLLRTGDVAGGVRHLERAVELQPEDATINGHLGDAYLAAGRPREAEFQWRRALSRNPEPDEERRIRARLDALPGPTATAGSVAP